MNNMRIIIDYIPEYENQKEELFQALKAVTDKYGADIGIENLQKTYE